ncbi:MAG: heme ABC exporter ATP-binding protein CcmA [Deltaproteobacteria bacterium]|nr:heme ABC exporter ATP-binding protein CcmA [Deltaproteobacteria bacterium]
MPLILSLENITKRFGYRCILNDITLKIETGEFITLIGNNGAGKSTLLRIISTLSKPTNGKITFYGKSKKESILEWRQKIGIISHENRLYGDLSSADNLRVFGTLYGVKDIDINTDQVLRKTDLIHVAQMPVSNFSSGMIKRLMIARLMLCKPKILILDEPFAGLDQNSMQWFENYLTAFHQHGGTVLMVTHQLDLGLKLANRVLVLHQQRIKHDNLASELSIEKCVDWLDNNGI